MDGFGAHAEFVLELEKVLAWETGKLLTGYTVTRKEATWLIILKAQRKGVNEVAFIEAESHVQAWREVYKAMRRKGGLTWKEDRFKPRG